MDIYELFLVVKNAQRPVNTIELVKMIYGENVSYTELYTKRTSINQKLRRLMKQGLVQRKLDNCDKRRFIYWACS